MLARVVASSARWFLSFGMGTKKRFRNDDESSPLGWLAWFKHSAQLALLFLAEAFVAGPILAPGIALCAASAGVHVVKLKLKRAALRVDPRFWKSDRSSPTILREDVGFFSTTAVDVLGYRWLCHELGYRSDSVSAALFESIFGSFGGPFLISLSQRGVFLFFSRCPLTIHQTASPFDMLPSRTRFIDNAVAEFCKDASPSSPRQLVILGAGFDTRATLPIKGVAAFEVDLPATQRVKKSMLKRIGIESAATFVEANFSSSADGTWISRLTRLSKYRRDVQTMFLFEGVVYYLEAAAAKNALFALGEHMSDYCGRGSTLALDYFSHDFVKGRRGGWVASILRAGLSACGEPLKFGVSRHRRISAREAKESRRRPRSGSGARRKTIFYDAYSDFDAAPRPAVADFFSSCSSGRLEVVSHVGFVAGTGGVCLCAVGEKDDEGMSE